MAKEKKHFYGKSNISNFKSNILYDVLVKMGAEEVDQWVDDLRQEVIDAWDNDGQPPYLGKTEKDIQKAYSQCRDYEISEFYHEDDPDDKESLGIVNNKSKTANVVNQFFPAMLKTRISAGLNPKSARSIYDYFSLPELKETFKKTMLRTLIQDSMCSYTNSLHETKNRLIEYNGESIEELLLKYKDSDEVGFFFRPYEGGDLDKLVTKYRKQKYVVILADEIVQLYNNGVTDDLMVKFSGGIDGVKEHKEDSKGKSIYTMWLLRSYDKKMKLFPKALQCFRLSLSQPAVNYPPFTARWLYEKYTEHIPLDQKVTVYDPSAGWGGRIIGAMSTNRDLHYVGTDPNTENMIDENLSRYEYVADYFNKYSGGKNTFEIFQDGSEVIRNNPEFQKYKGQLDFAFSSPPYWNREQYSQDETQSFKAHSSPEAWVCGFLKPTIETIWEYLKPERYFVWNIANIKVGKSRKFPDGRLELEKYSINIAKKCGFLYAGKLKMAMQKMSGLRPDELVNAVQFNGSWTKYEPMLVFWRPKE